MTDDELKAIARQCGLRTGNIHLQDGTGLYPVIFPLCSEQNLIPVLHMFVEAIRTGISKEQA
jgi:hypothetical protein